jgi:anti-sigma factor RsiW
VDAVAHLAIELLERYALKEVSEAEKQKVEKHVARCPKCRDHLLRDWEGFMSPDVT